MFGLAMSFTSMQTLWTCALILCSGITSLSMTVYCVHRYQNFAPKLKGRYLSSNVNITVLNESGKVVSVPVGSTYHSVHSWMPRD